MYIHTAKYTFNGSGFQINIVGFSKMPRQGGETYVWYTSKRLCHFRERLHDRLKEALCTLISLVGVFDGV